MRLGLGPAELQLVHGAAFMDTARLREQWGFRAAWNSGECVEDFARSVRGRVTLGKRVVSLPWRMATVDDLPSVDAPTEDG